MKYARFLAVALGILVPGIGIPYGTAYDMNHQVHPNMSQVGTVAYCALGAGSGFVAITDCEQSIQQNFPKFHEENLRKA